MPRLEKHKSRRKNPSPSTASSSGSNRRVKETVSPRKRTVSLREVANKRTPVLENEVTLAWENIGQALEAKQEEQEYVVEKVLASRLVRGKQCYLIKWLNYGEEWNSWEPKDNLKHCLDLLKEFEKASKPKTSKTTPSKSNLSKNKQGKTQGFKEEVLPNQDVFQVEAILASRMRRGQKQYLVKWLGFDDPKENTWEPVTHLSDCKELLKEFEAWTSGDPIAKGKGKGKKTFSASRQSSEELDEEEMYFVDKILDCRMYEGQKVYLVKWWGFDDSYNTWEPLSNLSGSADAVKAFDAKMLESQSAQPKKRGRPGKFASLVEEGNFELVEEFEAKMETRSPPPKKRGRGRPKKSAALHDEERSVELVEAFDSSMLESQSLQTKKRGRGRPKKDAELPVENDEIYLVEKILSSRVKANQKQYLIQWTGYEDPSQNTWEPLENLVGSEELIHAFELQQQNTPKKGRGRPKKTTTAPDTFAVEKLLSSRERAGQKEYLVKWLDYDDPVFNTWEPITNLALDNGGSQKLIREFEKSQEMQSLPSSTTTKKDVAKGKAKNADVQELAADEYFVKDIVATRMRKRKKEYLVKWWYYDDPQWDTWEPLSHLGNSMEMVNQFEAKLNDIKIKHMIQGSKKRKR